MQKTITLFFLFFTNISSVLAQELKLSGKITDREGKAIADANISVLKAADSSWVSSEIADNKGEFMLNLKEGEYLMSVIAIGYGKVIRTIGMSKDAKPLEIVLEKTAQALQEVTISSKAPRIETGLGKTIVNLEQASVSAGSSVLDLLRKSTGVKVDGGGNINLQGVSALVMIDDKQTYLSGEQLADYLKSLPAEQVAQLELITQPSSKYDAEGVGGIINIKMRRLRKQGLNGNLSLSAGTHVYPFTHNNANLTYRKNKLTVYTEVGYLYANGYLIQDAKRSSKDQQTGSILQTQQQHSFWHETFEDRNLKLGGDYTASDKITVGGNIKSIYHPNNQLDTSDLLITDASGNMVYNKVINDHGFVRTFLISNAYAKYQPAKEHNIAIDIDYLQRKQTEFQNLESNDYDIDGKLLKPAFILHGNMPTARDVSSIKCDYTGSFDNKLKLEAGLKGSYADVENGAFFESPDNSGGWKTDSARSNNFLYKESIRAAYLNCAKELDDKWQAQCGLRLEQTDAEGYQQFTGDKFTWKNTSLFPTAFIGYKLNDKNSFELNYGRRIVRRSYWELNPFVQFISQYAYDKGNPKLKPSFRNEITLKHNYNNMLFTSCSYRRINGVVGTVLAYDGLSKAVYLTYENNANRNVFVLTANFNKEIMTWWLLSADVNYYYNEFIDMLTAQMQADSNGLQYSITNQFKFKRGWSADTFYQYTSGDLQDRITRSGPAHYMNCSLSKKIWKDSATLKLSIEDPFHLYQPTEYAAWNGVEASSKNKYGTQSVSLGFSYNFGKRIENARRERSSDEAGRM